MSAFDIFLLLCIHCLGVNRLNLLELIISAKERVSILSLKMLDCCFESQRTVQRVGLQEAIVNFEEIDLIPVEKGVCEV
jgi:hypothetical protein